jgi:class 3 adenylate cyclase
MSEPAKQLAALLHARRQPGADRSAIDGEIHDQFGCELAVMFTDLVGFSRKVEAFGIVHFLQLILEAEELFEPLIAQAGGRCLKHEGDSLLATFPCAQSALRCAKAMQAATQAVNPGRPAEDRIDVCIGLGFGTVLKIGDEDVWGAEVNAASKLGEDIARAGEILLTERFRGAIPGLDCVRHGELFGSNAYYRLNVLP